MKIILIILLIGLVACNPLKHYQKVALDNYRNDAEKRLLSKACNEEFPLKLSDTVYQSLDSSAKAFYDSSYNALVDEYLKQLEGKDTVFITADGTKVIFRCVGADSLRVIKKFLATYHPPPVIQYVTHEVQVENTAKIFAAESKVKDCTDENTQLQKDKVKIADSRNTWRKAGLILGGVVLLFLIFLILYLLGKIKLPSRT